MSASNEHVIKVPNLTPDQLFVKMPLQIRNHPANESLELGIKPESRNFSWTEELGEHVDEKKKL